MRGGGGAYAGVLRWGAVETLLIGRAHPPPVGLSSGHPVIDAVIQFRFGTGHCVDFPTGSPHGRTLPDLLPPSCHIHQ